MNDRPTDRDLEARLSSAFLAGELPAAPSRLVDALERVPDASVVRGRAGGSRSTGRRTTFGLLGIAAAVAIGGGLVFGGAGLLRGPAPAPSSTAEPSTTLGTVVTYAIRWTGETPADPATLARLIQVMQQRIDATGAVGVTARSVGDDRVVVGFPFGVDPGPFRRLIGQRGAAAFVPLGTTQMNQGDPVDPATFPPLFTSDGIAGATVGTNQSGNRVVEITLEPAAAALFETYTAGHIGQYIAITIDGRVLSAPVINDAIPGGQVQISQDGKIGGYDAVAAGALVAVLTSGPLPVAVQEVSAEQGPVEPSPSAVVPPSASASPISIGRAARSPAREDEVKQD